MNIEATHIEKGKVRVEVDALLKCVTDVYPLGFDIPEGFKFKSFDIPKKGDWVLPVVFGERLYKMSVNREYRSKDDLRIILEKEETPVLKLEKRVFASAAVPVGIKMVGVRLRASKNKEGVSPVFDRLTKKLKSSSLNEWADHTEMHLLIKEAEDAGYTVDMESLKNV